MKISNLNDAILNETAMVDDGWTAVRHDKSTPNLFAQLQQLDEAVTSLFDDELTEPSDYVEHAHHLSDLVSRLSTSLGFPATGFYRDADPRLV